VNESEKKEEEEKSEAEVDVKCQESVYLADRVRSKRGRVSVTKPKMESNRRQREPKRELSKG
jgi:hypothetical protein